MNLVIYVIGVIEPICFLVPEAVISSDDLNQINNLVFNCDDASDEQWAIHDRLCADTADITRTTMPVQVEKFGVDKIYFVAMAA